MNVLLVAPQPFYTERGTPIAVRLLATELCALGHSVDLLVYPYGSEVTAPGLRVLRCRRLPFVAEPRIGFSWGKLLTDVSLTASLLRLAKRGRYDVIHAVEEAVYPVLALRWRHRSLVVYDMDSSLAEQMSAGRVGGMLNGSLTAAERYAVRQADQVIAVCESLADIARPHRSPDSVFVLPDIPLAGDADGADIERLDALVGPNRPIGLYVGNLERYQGIDLLLAMAGDIPTESPAAIVVIGGSEPSLSAYRAKASSLGLSNRLYFPGPRPVAHLNAYLSQADILLSPRVTGGNTPLKIYSYMASGRPILATRLDTHTQVLDDECAVLVEADDRTFAQAFVQLLADPARREQLAAAALARVRRDYSIDIFRSRLSQAYEQLRQCRTNAS